MVVQIWYLRKIGKATKNKMCSLEVKYLEMEESVSLMQAKFDNIYKLLITNMEGNGHLVPPQQK